MNNGIGKVGLFVVLFWLLTAILADLVITMSPLDQIAGMKNVAPGTAVPGVEGQYYLLGGDNLARDVFSRMVMGSRTVLAIAPAATLFAFMIAFTLGLPAGYFGGRFDTVLSFIANLVLAFPVILLFYLLVTPEIRASGIPVVAAAVLFLFPIIFAALLLWSRFKTQPAKLALYLAITLVLGAWAYSGLAFNADPLGVFAMDPNLLNIFVSVVFVNAPACSASSAASPSTSAPATTWRRRRRGETPWYHAVGDPAQCARPLIVDFSLRIGYTPSCSAPSASSASASARKARIGATINGAQAARSIRTRRCRRPWR